MRDAVRQRIGDPMLPHRLSRRSLRWWGIIEARVIDVNVKSIDFPESAVGIGDPELGLPGIATFDALLPLRWDADLFQSTLHFNQGRGIGISQPHVIERATRWLRSGIKS